MCTRSNCFYWKDYKSCYVYIEKEKRNCLARLRTDVKLEFLKLYTKTQYDVTNMLYV